MTPREFADACREERDDMLVTYADPASQSAVAANLVAARLSFEQRRFVLASLEIALTDAFYTMLSALDGCAHLGGLQQQEFRLNDESGAAISTGNGALAVAAYEAFYES